MVHVLCKLVGTIFGFAIVVDDVFDGVRVRNHQREHLFALAALAALKLLRDLRVAESDLAHRLGRLHISQRTSIAGHRMLTNLLDGIAHVASFRRQKLAHEGPFVPHLGGFFEIRIDDGLIEAWIFGDLVGLFACKLLLVLRRVFQFVIQAAALGQLSDGISQVRLGVWSFCGPYSEAPGETCGFGTGRGLEPQFLDLARYVLVGHVRVNLRHREGAVPQKGAEA